jgi:hypothetical protein
MRSKRERNGRESRARYPLSNRQTDPSDRGCFDAGLCAISTTEGEVVSARSLKVSPYSASILLNF